MAIVFKSNVVATDYMKDKSGYSGAKDHTLHIITSMNKAVKNGVDVPLASVLKSERNAPASVLLNDNLEYGSVEANQIRYSYLPEISTYGVIADDSNYDVMETPTSNVAYIGPEFQANTFAIYALKGKATLSSNDVTILGGEGTLASPMFFKRNNVTSPVISRSGGATQVCVVNLKSFMQVPFAAYLTAQPSGHEKLQLTGIQYSKAGSVLLRYAEPSRRTTNEVADEKPLLQISMSESEYIAVGKSVINEGIIIRLFSDGIEKYSRVYPELKAPNRGVNTVALSWDHKALTFAINGKVTQLPPFPKDILPTKISMLSAIGTWIPVSSRNALLNLVLYDRSLDTLELEKATIF